MAYVYDHNVTRPTGQAPTFSLNLVEKSDFSPTSDKPGEAVYVNLTSPVSLEERRKYVTTRIDNVYAGTNIEKSMYGPTKNGIRLYSQIQQSWSAKDSTDSTAPTWVRPVSASLSLTLPNEEFLTTADILALIADLVSGLYPDGQLDLARFVRGAASLLD